MNGTVEQRAGICRAEMPLPLVADFGVDRFGLGIGYDQLGDVAECGCGLGGSKLGLLVCAPMSERIDAAAGELTVLAGFLAGLGEAERGIAAQAHCVRRAPHGVAICPRPRPCLGDDKPQSVAVTVHSLLRGLDGSICQIGHPSPTSRHTTFDSNCGELP